MIPCCHYYRRFDYPVHAYHYYRYSGRYQMYQSCPYSTSLKSHYPKSRCPSSRYCPDCYR